MTSSRSVPLVTMGLLTCGTMLVALGVQSAPLLTIALAAALLLLGGLHLTATPQLPRQWLTLLGLLLIGYTFLDRSFAYVGLRSIFIGEVVLGVGLLIVIAGPGISEAIRSSSVGWLLALYIGYGASRTLPYLEQHGVNALRDAVIWSYSLFALLVITLLRQHQMVTTIPILYARVLPWFLLWLPVGSLIQRLWGTQLPLIPGSATPIIQLKPGHMAVHLAGIAAFLLLGLHRDIPNTRTPVHLIRRPFVWWGAWTLGAVLVTSANRGGLLAILVAMGLLAVLRPAAIWKSLCWLGLAAIPLLLGVNFSVDLGGSRSISTQQIFANLDSIRGGSAEGTLDNTRQWRLDWWSTIVDYTVSGEYFWLGKGFGINLADDDGFQVTNDGSLRSPHNGHIALLARTGVPGLMVWIALQVAFALCLLRAYFHARVTQQDWFARLHLWLLVYWVAFMVYAAFDVSLEGPSQGIWFWSLFGYGLVASEWTRRINQAPVASTSIAGSGVR